MESDPIFRLMRFRKRRDLIVKLGSDSIVLNQLPAIKVVQIIVAVLIISALLFALKLWLVNAFL